MNFPDYRPRRLRRNATLRRMVRETHLRVDDLIYPMFSAFGTNIKRDQLHAGYLSAVHRAYCR